MNGWLVALLIAGWFVSGFSFVVWVVRDEGDFTISHAILATILGTCGLFAVVIGALVLACERYGDIVLVKRR